MGIQFEEKGMKQPNKIRFAQPVVNREINDMNDDDNNFMPG